MIISPKITKKLAEQDIDESIFKLFPDYNPFYKSQLDDMDDIKKTQEEFEEKLKKKESKSKLNQRSLF